MDEKTIKEALLKGERVTLECKKAKAEVPKSVWATYSAFANTIGGLILLGVVEDLQEKDVSKRFRIIGVDERNIYYCKKFYTLYSQYITFVPQVEAEMKQTVLPQLEAKFEKSGKNRETIVFSQQVAANIKSDLFSVPWGHHR